MSRDSSRSACDNSSSSPPSVYGYDTYFRIAERFPVADEPSPERQHTPVPSRPASRAGSEDSFATPTRDDARTPPPALRERANSEGENRPRFGTDTDARILSVGSLTRSQEEQLDGTSSGPLDPQSTESLAWDDSDLVAPDPTRGALSTFALSVDVNEITQFYDPAHTSRGTEVVNDLLEHAIDPTMATGADAKTPDECVAALETAARVFEDDFEGLRPGDFPSDLLRQKYHEAENYKKAINVLEPRVSREPADTYPDELKRRVNAARRGFSTFTREGTRVLKDYEDIQGPPGLRPPPPGGQPAAGALVAPAATLSSARLTAVNDSVVLVNTQITSMVEMIMALNVAPTDERDYRTFTTRASAAFEQVASLKLDARRTIDEANQCGLETEMTTVSTNLRSLITAEQSLRATDQAAKLSFGAINSGGREYVVKPPQFSGDFKGMDYYTFEKDWGEFSRQKHVSNSQLLRILLKESLTGAAQRTCRDLESEKEVFAKLKRMFGNPKMLINAKLEEIAKLKRCDGSDTKRREWLIEADALLTSVEKLAIKHNLTSSVYHTPIVDQVIRAFRPEDAKRFRKFSKEQAKRDRQSTPPPEDDESATEDDFNDDFFQVEAADLFKYLLMFLAKMIRDVTYDINFDLTVHKFNEDRQKQSEAATRPSQKPPKEKVYTAQEKGQKEAKQKKKPTPKQQHKGQRDGQNSALVSVNDPTINASYKDPVSVKCKHCVGSHEYMYYCPSFQQASPVERMKLCHASRVCFRCLRCDSDINLKSRFEWWKRHEVDCQTEFTCKTENCGRRPAFRQYHMLMCTWHESENAALQEEFVKSLDKKLVNPGVKFFVHFPIFFAQQPVKEVAAVSIKGYEVEADISANSIFMVQSIAVDGQRLLVFYDSGCLTAAISTRAAKVMKTSTVRDGPTYLGVAGGDTVTIPYGDEQFALETVSDKKVTLVTGLQMDNITSDFPTWDIKSAWGEIYDEFSRMHDGKPPTLPPVADKVGGQSVDVMLGIRYLRVFPTPLYHLPSGLGIFESKIKCIDDNNLVLAGPHAAWNHALSHTTMHSVHFYFSSEMKAFYHQAQVLKNPIFISCNDKSVDQHREGVLESEVEPLDPCINEHCEEHEGDVVDHCAYSLRAEADRFFDAENVGGQITYRCLRCRACNQCRNSEAVDQLSMKEEREQALIDASVEYNPEQKRLFSSLPFVQDPDLNLLPNRFAAEKVLQSQLKIASASEDTKADILAAHNKLSSNGYVVKLSDLDPETQKLAGIKEAKSTYTIPWRVVYKSTSYSTPARLVFDASATTPSGESLNTILAKGENRLIKLHNVLLKFRLGAHAWTADIKMAYNQIYLKPEFYKYQLFLWKDNLDPTAPTETWVVKTLIYGVRPSGNLMMAAFKLLSDFCNTHAPDDKKGGDILRMETYVDDTLHAAFDHETAEKDSESFARVLGLGGINVKGFTFAHRPPPPEVSTDEKTIGLLGIMWTTKEDTICAEVKPLYFGKPKRGKLPPLHEGSIKEALLKNFTKREVLSQLARLYDPLGLLTPLTVQYKLAFSTICDLKTSWDEKLPEKFIDQWVENIQEIQVAKTIFFKRAVVPMNAATHDLSIIISTDASQYVAAACAHARIPLKGGGYSVQLLCARSKLTKNATIPKAEMRATVLGASLGHIVKYNLGDRCRDITYVTDSSIALHWINADSRPLETFVRNAVVEVRRLSDPGQWYHVASEDNVADIATRRTHAADIGPESDWQQGRPWMRAPREQWPVHTISEVAIAAEDKRIDVKDSLEPNYTNAIFTAIKDKVSERYQFSRYLYDPNKYNWAKAVRVMALVIKFVRLCATRVKRSKAVKDFSPIWAPPPPPPGHPTSLGMGRLNESQIRFGEHYYFYLATLEVRKFTDEKLYATDAVERYGILHYAGRILDGQNIDTPCDPFLDLEPLCFVRPVVDRHSPIAYSIMMFAHMTVSHHRTVPATLNESRALAFIFHGYSLAQEVKERCHHCKRIKAKVTDVEMGKIHDTRLTIAPPFYVCQCDIMGPFVAHCEHSHRSTVKIWVVVFKCVVTCSVAGYVMQAYSTPSVVQAYTRFGTRYGHPALILIDLGTQLVSACGNMQINIMDLAENLSVKYQVGLQHATCPARAHNYNGMVERSIREIKRLFFKVFSGLKMDMLTWETNLSWVCNELNNMPMCLGSKTKDFGNLDLITPSRILLGRANRRAMSGYPQLQTPSRMITQMDDCYDAWFKVWREERIVDFIPQPSKWKRSNESLKVGDIVVFIKERPEDHFGQPLWKLAKVVEIEHAADGHVRTATVEYRNASNPTLVQTTRVSVRHVAKLHDENELDLIQELNEAAHVVDDLLLPENLPLVEDRS